ncbi:stalk domain-containing protein [Natranaerofaba carboxydovora]|uniref:stalk domain-containing protein n=1 Tax=Natranaerofaba carboxydovora TaxID=2742683 RepID=UPI001F14962C|nr:stalk domain-containing protein [Natranaerofaba carboxydovora]UMZ74673.1 hypothetical protein ACONDI_02273 [Natranaerofaba carboxydovora]
MECQQVVVRSDTSPADSYYEYYVYENIELAPQLDGIKEEGDTLEEKDSGSNDEDKNNYEGKGELQAEGEEKDQRDADIEKELKKEGLIDEDNGDEDKDVEGKEIESKEKEELVHDIFKDVDIMMIIDSYDALIHGEEKKIEVAPTIREEDSRTFLPFRIIGEILDVEVDWNDRLKAVEAEYEGIEVLFFVDEVTAYVDGKPQGLDAKPYIDQDYDRIMVPLRFFAEAFGAEVEWYEDDRIITLML